MGLLFGGGHLAAGYFIGGGGISHLDKEKYKVSVQGLQKYHFYTYHDGFFLSSTRVF